MLDGEKHSFMPIGKTSLLACQLMVFQKTITAWLNDERQEGVKNVPSVSQPEAGVAFHHKLPPTLE